MENNYKTELIATGNCLDACIKILKKFDLNTKLELKWQDNDFEDINTTLSDFIMSAQENCFLQVADELG